jgi:hypothetical protein
MKIRPSPLAAAFVITSAAILPQSHAVTFDFTSPSDYTNNFQNTFLTTGSGNALATNGGAIVHTSTASGTAISAYDTAPDTTASNFFTNVTVEFDFSTTVFNSSFGVLFGGTSRANANLALFNINNSSNNDQLRIFSGKDWSLSSGINGSTSSPATNITLNSTTPSSNLNNGWTINKTYHAVFNVSYTDATHADVSLTISDPSSALASVSATASGMTLASTGGEIGLRTGFSASGGTMTIDNVQIYTSTIPEPSAFAILGGLGALGFATIRRRRR